MGPCVSGILDAVCLGIGSRARALAGDTVTRVLIGVVCSDRGQVSLGSVVTSCGTFAGHGYMSRRVVARLVRGLYGGSRVRVDSGGRCCLSPSEQGRVYGYYRSSTGQAGTVLTQCFFRMRARGRMVER